MLSDNTPALTSSLSSLLVCPALNNGESDPPIAKRPPTRARLLTSNESLRLLEEKERKKEAEALEKERKKNERAAKKKEREELLQKKKEERAKKAEERERKAEEKAKSSKKQGTKRKFSEIELDLSITEPSLPTAEPFSSTEAMSETVTGGSHTTGNGDGIDVNVCCMCFVHYDEDVIEGCGADWIYCKCGRWLHEDCVEEVVKDSEGVERFCAFCVDKYSV